MVPSIVRASRMHAALHPSQHPCMPSRIPLTACACWVQLDPWDAELADVPCWDADVRGTTLPPLLAAPFEACILRSGVVTAVLLNAICASPYADRLDQPPPQTTHSNIGIAVRFVQHPVAYSKSLCIIL